MLMVEQRGLTLQQSVSVFGPATPYADGFQITQAQDGTATRPSWSVETASIDFRFIPCTLSLALMHTFHQELPAGRTTQSIRDQRSSLAAAGVLRLYTRLLTECQEKATMTASHLIHAGGKRANISIAVPTPGIKICLTLPSPASSPALRAFVRSTLPTPRCAGKELVGGGGVFSRSVGLWMMI